VGNDVATRTVNSGATWHTEKLPKAATGLTLNAVACSSASLCYAAGQDSIPFEGYEVGGGVFLTYS